MTHANHERAVLDRIAIGHGINPERLNMGNKGAVFYRRGGELVCLCQRGSHYWNEIEAQVITVETIKRAARQ